jgi:HPt (histidine-containing phosphotransfer) domain-containing protein
LRIVGADDTLINERPARNLLQNQQIGPGRDRIREAGMEEELNRDDLLDRVEGDRALLQEIVDVFRDTYPGLLAETKQAVDRRDAAALTRSAHTIKGVVANFGARAAHAAALRLEKLARAQDLTASDQAFADLSAAVQRLDSALTRLLHDGGGP